MTAEPVGIGLVGCGNISSIYFRNLKRFPGTDLVACADLLPERAQARASEYGVRASEVGDLLSDPEIEVKSKRGSIILTSAYLRLFIEARQD